MHKLFKIWFLWIHFKQSCIADTSQIIIIFLSFSCNSSEPFAQNLIYTDTSSHCRLFVDGRLAGSSCLVGCAGVRPPRTSWQPCLRQPCARLLACSLQGWSTLNKNTILLRAWTLALEPYAKHYKATQEHHMILDRGRQQGKAYPGRVSEVKSTCHTAFASDSDIKKTHRGGLLVMRLSGKLLPEKTINIHPKLPESSLFTGKARLQEDCWLQLLPALSVSTCSAKMNRQTFGDIQSK